MSASYEEMEAKRQAMISSFKDIAAAMTRCVTLIEDYARLSPSTLTTSAALAAVENGAMAAETLAAAASGKKHRRHKEKKPKDPNAPKRPPSAYLLYQNEVRDGIRSANPGMAYKDVLGVIAQRWKGLSEEEKQVYERAYTLATDEFRKQDEAYKGGLPMPAPSDAAAVIAAAAAAAGNQAVAEVAGDSSSDEESSEEENAAAVAAPTTPSKKDSKKRKSKAGDDGKKKKKS